MIWYDSGHCRSRAHCTVCRALDPGRSFRASILSVFGVPGNSPDFACPAGHPWGYKDERRAPPFAAAVAAIVAMPDSESGRFLKAMAAQLQDLIRRGKGCRARLERKLFYYLATYGNRAKGSVS